VLDFENWRTLEDEHREIIRSFTVPFRERRSRNTSHPVYDFLFTYYAFPPGRLEQWHPGINVKLAAPPHAENDHETAERYQRFADDVRYLCSDCCISLKPPHLTQSLHRRLPWVIALLSRIQNTPARFGCFALHEWAMVYKLPEERRHAGYPLRVTPDQLEEVVDTQKLRCTHFDAYRFFTPEAAPQNLFHLHSDTRMEFEQGGCIHASMDLYKWAFLFSPWVGSELLRECFLLAIRARELDMRSSPYELSSLGFAPIPIETESGRNEFVQAQRDLANSASQVRQKLKTALLELLSSLQEGQDLLLSTG
jgi:hypothetical protein